MIKLDQKNSHFAKTIMKIMGGGRKLQPTYTKNIRKALKEFPKSKILTSKEEHTLVPRVTDMV